jgi:hypothetical protein
VINRQLDRFDFRLLDLIVLKVCRAFHVVMDVVFCPADLLVSQVEIDLKPLQGRISQFRLAIADVRVSTSTG